MKIKLCLLVVSMMLVISTAFANAGYGNSDEVDIDEHTCKEIGIFNNPDGAVIRLLQLEKAVINNIFNGQLIITNLSESGFEVFEFEVILAEMSLLLEEIQSVDVNSSEAVDLFVELKQDAIDLTKEFRYALHEHVDNATKAKLNETIQNNFNEQVQGLQISIKNKIAMFNKNQLNTIFRLLGKANSSILQEFKNGSKSIQQVKQQIALMIYELTKEKKFDLLVQLKSQNIRLQIRSRISIQNITNQYEYRKCNRLRNRLNNSENIDNEGLRLLLQQRLRTRINQSESSQPGNGNGQSSGGGNGSGSGSGQGSDNDDEPGNGNGKKNGKEGGGQ